jgi:glycosyltransferase involved in cell wall biosynthesis
VNPPIFEKAKSRLGHRIIHWGYADDFEEYARLLWKADILPVTSNQDFFGGSVVEAMYCGCFPMLPNRLAYSEHLLEEQKQQCLYNEGQFLNQLKLAIQNWEGRKFQPFVEK